MSENYVISRDKLIDRLSDMYHTDCLAVADCCDKVLDRSGALLGEVRERHSKIYGAVDNFAQQAKECQPVGVICSHTGQHPLAGTFEEWYGVMKETVDDKKYFPRNEGVKPLLDAVPDGYKLGKVSSITTEDDWVMARFWDNLTEGMEPIKSWEGWTGETVNLYRMESKGGYGFEGFYLIMDSSEPGMSSYDIFEVEDLN